MINGKRMVSRSGFASAQVLIVKPLISRGAINGISTTVPTTTSGMRASREAHVAAGFSHHLLKERRAGRQAGEQHHDDVWLRQWKEPG